MQERQELNLQPPVLETGALPIELLSYFKWGERLASPNSAKSTILLRDQAKLGLA